MARSNIDMDRRTLGRTAVLGAVAAALPLAARAQMPMPMMSDKNVIFTETDPGHWDAVKATHTPVVTVDGGMVTVKTPHGMSAAHFIVSHSVVLDGGVFLGRKTFTPADMPVSSYALPAGYKGKVTCTSTCNLHDFWLKSITV